MRRFDTYRFGYINTYPRVPPLPMNIVMEDRTTGTLYHLTHTGGTFNLSTTIPDREVLEYAPYDGPYLNGNIRLYIDSGVLTWEEVEQTYYDRHIYARSGNSRTIIQLGFASGAITYTVLNI